MNTFLLTETIDQDAILKQQIDKLTQDAIVGALAGVHVAAARVCPVTVTKIGDGKLRATVQAGNQRIVWEGPHVVWVAAVKAKHAERKRLELLMCDADQPDTLEPA
jgi:hypothetical protein